MNGAKGNYNTDSTDKADGVEKNTTKKLKALKMKCLKVGKLKD